MSLLAPITYVDPLGVKWEAPKGAKVNGASIPQWAWPIIGGPFEGNYREASVIHDVACDQRSRPWEAVHLAFYYAMLARKVGSVTAKTMYAAVYHFGPRWDHSIIFGAPNPDIAAAFTQAMRNFVAPASVVRVQYSPDASPATPGGTKVFFNTTPPPLSFTRERFQELERQIREREASGNGLTLEHIRNF